MIIAITHVFNNILEKTHIGTGSLYQYFGGYTNVSGYITTDRAKQKVHIFQTQKIK